MSTIDLQKNKNLQLAQRAIGGDLNRSDRTTARWTPQHANGWVDGMDANRREQLQSIIESASLEDVNTVISKVLDTENYVFSKLGQSVCTLPTDKKLL